MLEKRHESPAGCIIRNNNGNESPMTDIKVLPKGMRALTGTVQTA